MAQEPKAAAAEGEAAPKSKKKLIIIIAAVLLLAGGGGGAWFMMHKKADAEHGKKVEEKHEEPAPAPVFLPLETFTVNLQPDPDEKFLQLDISVQVPKPEIAEAIKAQMPAVRSRLLMLLTSKMASEISTPEGKQQLTEEIVEEIQKPFTEEGKPQEVLGVFFTSFVIQ